MPWRVLFIWRKAFLPQQEGEESRIFFSIWVGVWSKPVLIRNMNQQGKIWQG